MPSSTLEQAWSSSDVFSRTYTMFGILMVLIFITRAMWAHLRLIVLLAAFFGLYVKYEYALSDVMAQMAVSSSYFNRTPWRLVPGGLIMLSAAVFGVYVCPHLMPTTGFISYYLFSLFESLVIFMFSTAIKTLLLGTGLINFKVTRRGFFGVFQRLFLFLRNIAITPIWIKFFCGVTDVMELWRDFGNHGLSVIAYLLLKALIQLWLLWDLGFSLSDFMQNRSRMLRQVKSEEVTCDCVICQDKPYEPVAMPCGHTFCYSCAYRWLAANTTCPVCRQPVCETKKIEFADGAMPLASLFSAF